MVQEPEKEGKNIVVEFIETIIELLRNPTARWVTLGGAARFFESFCFVYYAPSFYQGAFPNQKSQYALLNGMIQTVAPLISSVSCGIISDRFEKKNKMTKAYIGIVGAIIGSLMAVGISLFRGVNFYVSLAFLFFKFLLTEGWMAPTITMMQGTVGPQQQGSIVSAYLFFLYLSGTVSAVSMGAVANHFNALSDPWIYGKVIFGGTLFGYLASIPCFWKAGKAYVAF